MSSKIITGTTDHVKRLFNLPPDTSYEQSHQAKHASLIAKLE